MDYNLEILVVIDKLLASAPFNIKFSARNFLQQAGNFCPPYVVFPGDDASMPPGQERYRRAAAFSGARAPRGPFSSNRLLRRAIRIGKGGQGNARRGLRCTRSTTWESQITRSGRRGKFAKTFEYCFFCCNWREFVPVQIPDSLNLGE